MNEQFLQDVWDILCDTTHELEWAGVVEINRTLSTGMIHLRVWDDDEPTEEYVRLYGEFLEQNLAAFRENAVGESYRADINFNIIAIVDAEDASEFDSELADLYIQQFGLGELTYG